MNWQELRQASLDDILAWAEAQPWCRTMADCAQDAEWHSEGDVWTHTKMVVRQLLELDEWPSVTPHEQIVLIFTASEQRLVVTAGALAHGRVHGSRGTARLQPATAGLPTEVTARLRGW